MRVEYGCGETKDGMFVPHILIELPDGQVVKSTADVYFPDSESVEDFCIYIADALAQGVPSNDSLKTYPGGIDSKLLPEDH